MNRESKNVGVILEDQRCSITLMKIQINDDCSFDKSIGHKSFDGNCNIMNYAVSTSTIWKCVMIATAEIGSQSMLQSLTSGQQCSTTFEFDITKKFRELFRRCFRSILIAVEFKNIQPGLLLLQGLKILLRVNEQDVFIGDEIGLKVIDDLLQICAELFENQLASI